MGDRLFPKIWKSLYHKDFDMKLDREYLDGR